MAGHRKYLELALGALAVAAPAWGQTPPPNPAPAGNTDAVTVTGTRPGVTTSIDSRAYLIDRDLNASTGTLAEALRNVPSVQVDIDGNVSLRGDSNVQILVDGRPSPLFAGPSRPQAILNFPAKDIERVEVMTTPSAAYGPEGSGGIINIITKTPNKAMTTASVSAQYRGAGGGSVSGNYSRRAGKFSINATGNYSESVPKNVRSVRRVATPSVGAPLQSAIDDVISIEQPASFANLDLGYDLTPKWRVTGNASFGSVTARIAQSIAYRAFTNGAPVSAFDTTASAPHYDVDFTGAGTTLTRKFSGPEHDLSAVYNFSRNSQFIILQNDVVQILPGAAGRVEQTFFGVISEQDKFRLNYRGPLPGMAKLSIGYEFQGDDVNFDNFFGVGPSASALVVDPALSTPYAFDQQINSLFATYERPISALTAQWGLRAEMTDMTIARTIDRDYRRLYPSLNLGYKISDETSLRGGYSRRVQRPNPLQLNPFRQQSLGAAFLLQQGNPDLQPQETDSFELGYQYRKAQTSYLATVYWRIAHDEFTPVTRDIGGGFSVTRPENLGSSRSVGIELVANGRLASALKYSLNSNTFWKEIDAGNLGFAGGRSALGVSGNANLTWDATTVDAVQLNAIATGKRLTAQGYSAPYWTLNLGWRHKLNDRISATLTLRDMLDTARYKDVTDTPALHSYSIMKQPTGRTAMFQLTYNFGASKPADSTFDFGGGGSGGVN